MKVRIHRERPEPWDIKKQGVRQRWLLPFWALEWALEWCAYALSRWTFLDVLEYLEGFSVLIAVIFYFSESGDRLKQKHYQAWQVINTAQGKGGNGGRIDALQELVKDGVSLTGVDLAGAFLQGVRLDKGTLIRSNFHNADLRGSSLVSADLSDSDLTGANFRNATLTSAVLKDADLTDADLSGSNLQGVDLNDAKLDGADMRGADLKNVHWEQV